MVAEGSTKPTAGLSGESEHKQSSIWIFDVLGQAFAHGDCYPIRVLYVFFISLLVSVGPVMCNMSGLKLHWQLG